MGVCILSSQGWLDGPRAARGGACGGARDGGRRRAAAPLARAARGRTPRRRRGPRKVRPLLALAIGCLVFATVYIAYCWFEREAARKREEEARDAEARAQREEARRTREKRRRAREETARAHLEEGVNGAREDPPPIEMEPLTAFQMPSPMFE